MIQQQPTQEKPLDKIQGSVERVTFHNSENGFCVLRIKVKNHRELVTLIGHLSSITPGEFILASGNWIQNKEHGLQFQAKWIKTVHPNTLEGIEKYLGSGLIKGIGPHFAKKLVKAFQEKVFDVIENHPEDLRKVEGIGPVRIQKITEAWKDQKIIREIMVFLQSHGVSTSRAVRIYKTYGQDAIQIVTENPYRLAKDIHGIGFKSADIIAQKLGISPTSLIRARAGIHYVLYQKINDGHCAYPHPLLLEESVQLLEISKETLLEALNLEVEEKELVQETIQNTLCVFPASIHRNETDVAHLLFELKSFPFMPWEKINEEKAIEWVSEYLKIQLADLQKEAIHQALNSKVLVITGGPGTGKTTLTRSLVEILKAKKMKILLCSPTGRAAKRLSECTGMEAKTIHRLLGFDPKQGGFLHHKDHPLVCDVLILDEASMVDISIFCHLLKAMPSSGVLILVGDVDQIPSVGPGEVLKSLIDSDKIPTVKLTQIFRQAAQSQIIQSAHQINQGFLPDLRPKDKSSDFHFLSVDEPEPALTKIIELVKTRIPKAYGFDPIKDIQILSPMNRGILGTRSLNFELQKALNPEPTDTVERFGYKYSPGDKVMVIQNDYDKEVFNGDIGFIKEIQKEDQSVLIDFDGRDVCFDFGEMDLLSLAYAVSIHKSQGSEYPVVLIPFTTQHYMMLKKNLIYTGITRGKKLVILVGQKKALSIAIKAKNQTHRWNQLAERLQKLL